MSVNNEYWVLNTFNKLIKFFVQCKFHSNSIFKHLHPLHQHRHRHCYRLQLLNPVAVLKRSRKRVA